MKRIKEYIRRDIAGEIILVPAGQTAEDFNGMLTVTDSGAFIWEHLEEARDFNHLVELILDEYEVDRETAAQDASAFLMQMLQAGMVKPTGNNW